MPTATFGHFQDHLDNLKRGLEEERGNGSERRRDHRSLSDQRRVRKGLATVAETSPETFRETASDVIDSLGRPVVLPATFFSIGLAAIWLFRYWRRTVNKRVRGEGNREWDGR